MLILIVNNIKNVHNNLIYGYPNNPKATTLSWSIILAPAMFCKVIFPSDAIIQLKNYI